MSDARPPENRAEMPFLDHLEELRWRILYSLLAIVVGTLIGWLIVQHVDLIGLLIQPIKPLIPGGKLRVTSPTEPFLITLKFAFVVGLVLSSPIVGYQAWAFLTPALYERERRLIVPALSAGALLFLGGATAAYLWVLPRALTVLLGFQQAVFDPLITADRYFAFAAQLILAFGVITELPLVVVILAALGLVTPQFLSRNRRYAIALSAGAAALLAPPDAVSMLLMMVPLWLLYEVSILCAWVLAWRRARRASSGGSGNGAGAASAAALALLLLGAGGRSLAAQIPTGGVSFPRPTATRADTTRAPGDTTPRALDTATARRLGLPTAPKRSFPAADAMLDSLLKLRPKYRITQYVADTLIVQGGDSGTIHLRGDAYSEREGTKLEADSIRYQRNSCRLDAVGDPKMFEEQRVLVGEGMGYDTCVRRGTVHNALTSVQQAGAVWYVRGDLAVDSQSTRIYGANSDITSDDNPVPDYHFAAGEMKWLSKDVMVARPAMLFVHDVPIMWLPFIFQDVRRGRRSGILVPRFGLSDLVRPTRSYHRHVANLGYYFVVNDYLDFLVSADWYADRYFATRAQSRYRWLDRFINGSIAFDRFTQLDTPGNSIRVGWNHQQSFSSRTTFNASIDYATSTQVIQSNTVNPYLATAQLSSQASFNKQFDWGTLAIGGTRRQPIGSGPTTQGFPSVTLTPSPINVTPAITWSPGFTFTNTQTFNQPQAPVLTPTGAFDTLFSDNRQTGLSVQTPLRIGRWNWNNAFTVNDVTDNSRQEVDIPDSTVKGGVRRVVYYRTFSTGVDWQTAINLPSFFTGTWNLQPGLAIVNQTGAGPYRLRNQYTGGEWVQQGKRLQFSAGVTPTLFGFFPGFGPLARIRHSISPIISYSYAPGSRVDPIFARAIDPTGQNFRAQSDPQQTINLGLSQNIEAKLKPPAGDTSTAAANKKIRLLGINTSAVSYNFEQAKQAHHTGWQTPTLNNAFASDLLPGFTLTTTHDLWRGPGVVGTDSAHFDPFLTNVSANFTIRQATLDGLARLVGLGAKAAPTPAPGAPSAPGAPTAGGPQQVQGSKDFHPPEGLPGGGGQGFSLTVAYTINRPRPSTTPLPPGVLAPPVSGERTMALFLTFQPTAHWSASWRSNYDFDLQQFGSHELHLERDLHRWHASFSFLKSPTGSYAFSFFVSLLDQPDIKFNYSQTSFVQ